MLRGQKFIHRPLVGGLAVPFKGRLLQVGAGWGVQSGLDPNSPIGPFLAHPQAAPLKDGFQQWGDLSQVVFVALPLVSMKMDINHVALWGTR